MWKVWLLKPLVFPCEKSDYWSPLFFLVKSLIIEAPYFSLWKVWLLKPLVFPCEKSDYWSPLFFLVKSLIIEAPCFSLWKVWLLKPLVFPCAYISTVWWGFHDTLVTLDSTYCSPVSPKMIFFKLKTSWSDYFHIIHVSERIAEDQNGSTMIIEMPQI